MEGCCIFDEPIDAEGYARLDAMLKPLLPHKMKSNSDWTAIILTWETTP